MSARRILVIFNPAAGGARRTRFDRVVAQLRAASCQVDVIETTGPGHAEALARTVSPSSYDVVAACGGDGTVNEVINGLEGNDVALGIIPLGTANVLAEEIGLVRTPEKIAATLSEGPIRTVHVGRANGRRFTMMAGVGFDAVVVSRVSLRLKKLLGPFAYVWESMRQAVQYGFHAHEVTIDGVAYRPVSMVACKGRRYGGPFIAAPDASLGEDKFYVVLMNGRGWLSVIRYAIALALGKITAWQDVQLIAAREVIVGGTGQPVQADGDIIATLPLRIALDPHPVRLVYPI
ncbi:MAG: diacylglycerol kinase family lipid kinase [Proteobacteria bacterium]|nr:diacylglycerol kinase family lipid kinase [Pseudomonadota bacterium]